MKADVTQLKKLREETGASIMDVKNVLEEHAGDYEKAKADLIEKGKAKAEKKSAEREAGQGLVHAYIHTTGKLGSLIHVACETDFVAKTDDFQKLCHELAMQVCTEDYQDVPALLEAEYMRDPTKQVKDVVQETSAKTGEKVEIKQFVKYAVC